MIETLTIITSISNSLPYPMKWWNFPSLPIDPLNFFFKRTKIAINLELQMIRVLVASIIKVITTMRTVVPSLYHRNISVRLKKFFGGRGSGWGGGP